MTVNSPFPLEQLPGSTGLRAQTDPRYWNQIGPFGGWLAGLAMAAMRRRAPAGWAPRSVSVEFLGALPAGEIGIAVTIVRRQRRVAGLRAELSALGDAAPAVVANAVFGLTRESDSMVTPPLPSLPAPRSLPRFTGLDPLAAFVRAFDYRVSFGEPFVAGPEARSGGWVRPGDPLEPAPETLLLLADAWFPPGWVTRREPVPVSTLCMQVVFHQAAAGRSDLGGFFAVSFREDALGDGFGIERGELWWPDGRLALTSQQLIWIGESSRRGQ
jgi:acyl-CoA thioesterase